MFQDFSQIITRRLVFRVPMSKFRNFCFTQNNYTNTELVDGLECKYIVYGKEIGESGTPHLQGFVTFLNPRAMSGVIKSLPGCHVEIARTVEEAIAYCKKDGDFVERGVMPAFKVHELGGEATKRKWENIWELAKCNKIEEVDPEERIKHYKTLRAIQKDYGVRADDLDVPSDYKGILWIWGAPGCGKSRFVRDTYAREDIYDKTCNKWWDGYAGEKIVLLDDFGKSHKVLGEHIKRWGDRYSFPAEIKGGKIDIRPERLIVTSNYAPCDVWDDDNVLLQAILRRTEIKFMM